ncbi:MAG TPA: SDR family NAD(P)-dependent oxidoreductase [bacterium]|nr:SDR family NAD(P)-dependent oxidoreductase [bacterium]
MNVQNKRVVLVTGASRGIGRALAVRFAGGGDTVVVNYLRREGEAMAALKEIRSLAPASIAVQADVSTDADVERMFSQIRERFGRLDVLINNAGTKKGGPLVKMTAAQIDAVMAVNVKGPFLCSKAAARLMIPKKTGHIVNIGSMLGSRGAAGEADYAASKAALVGLSKSVARELGRSNICVNSILPGLILTDMGGSNRPEFIERVRQENCLGRLSDMREIADFVYELSQKKNISGQLFNLDSRIL